MNSHELLDSLLEGNQITSEDFNQFRRENTREDQYFEYKDGQITSYQNRQEGTKTIREYVSGFANADGGTLIVGVNDHTHKISGCQDRIGQQYIDDWASRCLQDMAYYFSPPPRFYTLNHPDGIILFISVVRSQSLVPCVESRELKYFIRIGDSTVQAPEFLLSDLVLGRRQHPVIDITDIKPNALLQQDGGLKVVFSIFVENISLIKSDNIEIGLISWAIHGKEYIVNRFLKNHIDIVDPRGNDSRTQSFSWNITHKRRSLKLAAFQQAEPCRMEEFNIPYINYVPPPSRFCLTAAIYVMPQGSQPQWFELQYTYTNTVRPTKQGNTPSDTHCVIYRKIVDRPRVSWTP